MFPARTSRNALPRPEHTDFQFFRRAAAVPALWKARIADGALGHHVGSADRGLRVCRLMLFRAAKMRLQPMDANASGASRRHRSA
jgi:hypothetical protein